MSSDTFEPEVKEEQNERIVSYRTDKAFITIHIPKRTESEQTAFENNAKNALRQFYRSIVSNGCDLNELAAKYKKQTT